MSRTSLDYFEDIVDAMQNAQSFVGGLDYSDFANDKKTTFATARAIQIIGEATKRIPEDVRNRFPNIPWSDMAGMRGARIFLHRPPDSLGYRHEKGPGGTSRVTKCPPRSGVRGERALAPTGALKGRFRASTVLSCDGSPCAHQPVSKYAHLHLLLHRLQHPLSFL